MLVKTPLARAISIYLTIALLTTAGMVTVAFAQSSGPRIQEEVVVTGSRIERTEGYDNAAHVVVVDEFAIDALAELNIADVLRTSPLNAYGSHSERSGNSAQSNATIDLRGLGAERTLVMVDGMRLPGSPNLGADQVNINMLPMNAVKRIDILADGASAIYGADAVAGVVNIVTQKDFEGVEITSRWGDRDRDFGGDKSLGILAGTRGEKSSLVFALEYSLRDPVFDRDRKYTAPWIRDTDGDGVINAYIDTDGISLYGRTWEIYDPNTDYYELKAAADCPTTDGFSGVMGAAAFGEPDGTLCTYAYADISANRAELEKVNSFVYGTYEVNDNLELYAQGLFSKNKSFGRFAPPAAGWPNPPADHAHNPFDVNQMITDGLITDEYELWGYYRWTNIGPRDNFVDDTQYDITVGLKGDITEDISFEIYAQNGRYDSKEVGNYYLSYTGLDYVLANDIDPFSAEGAGAMKATPTQDNYTKQRKIYSSLQFSAGDLFGAGESIALIGVEKVDLGYSNQYDAASEAGLIGGSAGNSSAGDRDFISFFFEYVTPLTANSELNIAGRHDDYSDFGSAFSPTISYSINLTDTLSLRARWGEGFKAPSLADMYGPETFSAEEATDPVTDTTRQFDTFINVNPDLEAESSESYSFGVNWEYLAGHMVDVAYFSVTVEDVISTPTTQSLLYADAAGVSFSPTGSRVERNNVGNVTEVFSFSENSDKLEVNGIDLQLHSNFDTGFGFFNLNLFLSRQLEYKQNAYFKGGFQDTAGFFLQPELRAQGSVLWSLGDHAVDLTVNYIGEHSEEDMVDSASGALTTSSKKLDDWTTVNLAYRFDAGTYGQIKVGANNITDKDPVLDKDGKYFQDFPDLYDALGRVWFVEFRKTFD